jgi:hypothetical protein
MVKEPPAVTPLHLMQHAAVMHQSCSIPGLTGTFDIGISIFEICLYLASMVPHTLRQNVYVFHNVFRRV